jgi:hypothetical protein
MPFFDPFAALRTFGLPDSLANDRGARVIMNLMAGRNVTLGAAIWLLYLQGKLAAVDTVLGCLGIIGVVDMWVCWREREIGTALFRGANALFFAGWGILGLTAGRGNW